MKFLKNPNLPSGRVCMTAVGCAYPSIHSALSARNIESIKIQRNNYIQPPISCHADMTIHHLRDNYILIAKNESKTFIHLQKAGFQCNYISKPMHQDYPNDVLLNACRIGDLLLCNTKVISREILDYSYKNRINVKHVNQGYTKCSVCIVNKNAVITSDKQIAKICSGCNIDVLEIRPGYIELEGLSYGFIGGCTGLLDKNLLAFTGNIESHPDSNDIKKFLKDHCMQFICLQDGALVDIGGIIPLLEE